jgi:hypothetical protein
VSSEISVPLLLVGTEVLDSAEVGVENEYSEAAIVEAEVENDAPDLEIRFWRQDIRKIEDVHRK